VKHEGRSSGPDASLDGRLGVDSGRSSRDCLFAPLADPILVELCGFSFAGPVCCVPRSFRESRGGR
jgi:hypothetical protein